MNAPFSHHSVCQRGAVSWGRPSQLLLFPTRPRLLPSTSLVSNFLNRPDSMPPRRGVFMHIHNRKQAAAHFLYTCEQATPESVPRPGSDKAFRRSIRAPDGLRHLRPRRSGGSFGASSGEEKYTARSNLSTKTCSSSIPASYRSLFLSRPGLTYHRRAHMEESLPGTGSR